MRRLLEAWRGLVGLVFVLSTAVIVALFCLAAILAWLLAGCPEVSDGQ
jgi:hypothetical protein